MRLGSMLGDRNQNHGRPRPVQEALEVVDLPEDGDRVGLRVQRHVPAVRPTFLRPDVRGIDEADDLVPAPRFVAEATDQLPGIAASPHEYHSVGEFATADRRLAPLDDILAFAHRSPPIRR